MRISTREMWEVNKYLWLCLLFVGLYLPWVASEGRLLVPLPMAYGLFGLAILNGGLRTYYGWRGGGFNGGGGWICTAVDLGLISLAVRITGGIDSELWLVYYVLLISETLFSTTRQVTLINLCLIGGY